MAQAKPYMTVNVQISPNDVKYAAECLADDLFEEFEREVFDMLGITEASLREDLLTFPAFQRMVTNGVLRHGMDALDEPYDYMDYDTVYITKEWESLYRACEQMQAIVSEIYRADSIDDDCARAVETLKRAGFKIVKA